ncbi:MAG: OmpA family protein [Bacteroidetes bacterium]|nr:OmpA family protein [Bacteroidota bacterium]
MKKLVLAFLCLAVFLVANAQTIDKKWNIGLHGGISQYKGDLGSDFYKTDMARYGVGGISFSRYLTNHFDASLFVTKGTVGYNRSSGNFRRDFTAATLNIRFNILGARYAVRPYLFAGAGGMLFDKNINISEKKMDYIAPAGGGGINFRLNPTVMLNLQETFYYSTGDNRDGVVAHENDAYLLHTVGFSFNFGKKKDADHDGISDYRDKCPNTPASVPVDKAGCPLDKDGDGVADYLDACPDQAGIKDLQGCPDMDGDGIADKDDKCPELSGPAALMGCPDADKDGIADKDDRCPEFAGSAALKGCPDADNDGVADIDDKCPNTHPGYKVDATGCALDNDKDGIVNEEDACPDKAGILSMKGCPDSDGDGVSDLDDRCPTVKGTIANKGCPEMAIADVKKITQIASKIFFETNSDKLKVASLVQLDELASILKRYEEANLLIEGHADSQGDDAYNLALSQKRTESVKTYLMGKGIMESRLTAIGYGESRPIADNATSLGRAKNRRVELKTSY